MILLPSVALAADPDPAELVAALRAHLSRPAAIHLVEEVVRIDRGQSVVRGDPMVVSRSAEDRRLGVDGDGEIAIHQRVGYPYVIPLDWSERISGGSVGEVRGADTFGGPRRQEMAPARMATREKQRLIEVPGWLVDAIEPLSAVIEGDEVAIEATWGGSPVQLRVDPEGTRIDEVRWLEDFPPLGDVEVAVRYGDWRDGIPWEIREEGAQTVITTRSAVEALPTLAVAVAGDPPSGPAESALGWSRASWEAMWLGFGFPQDASPLAFDLRWREVAPGVHQLWGEFHNVLVVELGGDRLAMVEAPLCRELVDQVLDEIAARWPRGEVVGAVLTHHHLDHAGGIQAVAARGIPLVVPAADEGWVRELLARPSTVAGHDPIVDPELVPVTDRIALTGPDRTVEIRALAGAHAENELVAWIPDVRVLEVADLVNPGLIPTRGPYGWLARKVIAGIDPYDLQKAGTYAQSLSSALVASELDPQRFVGGHGPQVAREHALRVLARYADQGAFAAHLAADMTPPTGP